MILAVALSIVFKLIFGIFITLERSFIMHIAKERTMHLKYEVGGFI